MNVRRVARLVAALAITFVLIYFSNLAPQYFGPVEDFVLRDRTLFAGTSLIVLAAIWLWRSGYWRTMQSRGWLAGSELVEVGLLLVVLTMLLGIGLTPFNLCIGGGSGYTCYPDLRGFLGGFLDLLCIVLAEELFFRAYLISELGQLLRTGGAAVVASALLYSFFHLPALQVEGFGEVSWLGFMQIFVGAVTLSASYWYTGKNLAAVVLLHAYWDGVGALVFIPNVGQYGPVLILLGQLTCPALAVIATHALRISEPFGGPTSQSTSSLTRICYRRHSGITNCCAPDQCSIQLAQHAPPG